MAIKVSMEGNVTLTKDVTLEIESFDIEKRIITVVLDKKIKTKMGVIEGSGEELTRVKASGKLMLSVSGLVYETAPAKTSDTTGKSQTRSGSAVFPKIPVR